MFLHLICKLTKMIIVNLFYIFMRAIMKSLCEKVSDTRSVLVICTDDNEVDRNAVSLHMALALQRKSFNVGVLNLNFSLCCRGKVEEDSLCSSVYNSSFGVKVATVDGVKALEDTLSIWSDMDFLIITISSREALGIKNILAKLRLTGALIVTTPSSKACSKLLKDAISMFRKIGMSFLGVVENESHFIEPISKVAYYPKGSGKGQMLASYHGISFLGEIPIVESLSNKLLGRSVDGQIKSPLISCYDRLLGRLLEKISLQAFQLAPCV